MNISREKKIEHLLPLLDNIPQKQLISNIKKRFLFLSDTLEDDEADIFFNFTNTINTFIKFMTGLPNNIIPPSIVLSENGNVSIIWEKTAKQLVSIELLSDNDVRYLIFYHISGNFHSTSGCATIETILKILSSDIFMIFKWMLDTEDYRKI